MRRFLFLLLFLLLPTITSAQNVTVRSGEHDRFVRLVLAIGTGSEWDVRQSETGAVLTLPNRSVVFETGEIFKRIPRTRLLDVTQEGANQLQLRYDCLCHTNAFLWQPGQLVIDVIDGPDPLATSTKLPAPPQQVLPNLLTLDVQNGDASAINPAAFGLAQDEQRQEELKATEAALAEGLARATGQGFLIPAVRDVPPVVSEPEPVPDARSEQIETSDQEVPPMLLHPGVGISTALDRDLALIGELAGELVSGPCLPADMFDLQSWAGDGSFHTETALAIEAIAGEFGEAPFDAQERLAKTYLYYGFGAEARMVLSLDPVSSQLRQILLQLAAVIDEYDETASLLQAQAECATAGAMWAFLHRPHYLDEARRNTVIQHYAQLPQPLRGQLAARLARHFLAQGEPDAAETVLRAAAGQDAEVTHAAQSAQALLAEGFGRSDVALTMLENEAGETARISPASAILMVRLAIEQGQTPTDETLLLVAALRHEYRSDPVAEDLETAEALGRLAKGEHQAALELVKDLEGEEALAVLNQIYSRLAGDTDDGFFLETSFAPVPEGLTAETRNVIAERLLRTGFPDRAEVFLAPAAQGEAAAEQRYLRAEAALLSRRYDDVLSRLQGLSDDRARALRAQAYTGLGDHERALTSLNPASGGADPVLEFRAEAWDRLTLQTDQSLSGFAGAVLQQSIETLPETLAERRDILDQSQQTRQAVEDLLVRFDFDLAEE